MLGKSEEQHQYCRVGKEKKRGKRWVRFARVRGPWRVVSAPKFRPKFQARVRKGVFRTVPSACPICMNGPTL